MSLYYPFQIHAKYITGLSRIYTNDMYTNGQLCSYRKLVQSLNNLLFRFVVASAYRKLQVNLSIHFKYVISYKIKFCQRFKDFLNIFK